MSLVDRGTAMNASQDRSSRVVATLRPVKPETAMQINLVELRESDFPFFLGRQESRAEAVCGQLGGQELKVVDGKPFQVSRNHCSLELRDEGVVVNDRGSTLGTIVDHRSIGRRSGRFMALLRPGDHELVLGNARSEHRFIVTVHDETGS